MLKMFSQYNTSVFINLPQLNFCNYFLDIQDCVLDIMSSYLSALCVSVCGPSPHLRNFVALI